MNKQDELALIDECIEHHIRFAEGEGRVGEAPDATDCALCGVFEPQSFPPCTLNHMCPRRCPIYRYTGVPSCFSTPWQHQWNIFSKEWDVLHGEEDYQSADAEQQQEILAQVLRDHPLFREASVDEVEFLKEVREAVAKGQI